MGHAGVGWVMLGWGGPCRGEVGWVMQGLGGVGWGGSCRGGGRVRRVMQGWWQGEVSHAGWGG